MISQTRRVATSDKSCYGKTCSAQEEEEEEESGANNTLKLPKDQKLHFVAVKLHIIDAWNRCAATIRFSFVDCQRDVLPKNLQSSNLRRWIVNGEHAATYQIHTITSNPMGQFHRDRRSVSTDIETPLTTLFSWIRTVTTDWL
ncbi:hypothetical protein F2P81_017621 [Scophthalmus maximus]|uniref:Uncharacterized protein n=1 Tax=Scophthalmus maximus TaxID=52904 RepID=A0A6A4SG82_SCOMX|nr:hypothetical protein F2P81_017621 [Scophthalmus maximus]